MFQSEAVLREELRRHNELVRRCANGSLSFERFCEEYNNFWSYYALDGHESDEEERVILEKYEDCIEPHRIIAFDILGKVCSEDDAKLSTYQQAGRFGAVEAVNRLRHVHLRDPRDES